MPAGAGVKKYTGNGPDQSNGSADGPANGPSNGQASKMEMLREERNEALDKVKVEEPPKTAVSGASEKKGEESSKSVDPNRVKKSEEEVLKKRKIPPEPDYTGWKQVGGWDERVALSSQKEADDLLQRSTLLESYVSDKYYGDWYHNTALIVFTAFFSWLVARLGGGLAWLAIILTFTGTAYRTSVRRLRRNTRDDITRDVAMKKLETDTETLEWLNTFLVKFWLIYEPVLSATVIATANQVLVDATPGFIESLSLSTFTLGTKPPRVDHVRTFPKTQEDIAVMDWRFSFTPNDTEDLTARQLKSKVNPKVVLSVRIGKGVVSKSLPILVEDMSFSGFVRVRIKMMTSFPHIQTVDVSFLEPPEFDFVLKPVGGETFGFDINVIPGLTGFIKEMVHSNLGPMLYAPNAFQVNVQQMLAGSGLDSSIGVLAVTVHYAKGIKGSEAIGNTIDPYIKFSFNEREELARTDIKDDTKNPTWNETKYLLVKNLNEVLTMQVVDFNDFRKDKDIGVVNFALESLKENPDQEAIVTPILSAGKSRGQLVYDCHWYPVLEGRTLDDGTVEPPPTSNTGIVRFTVHQCKELDSTKSMVGQLSPYAQMFVNDRMVNHTKTLKRTNDPVWDETYEVLVTNRNKCKLGVAIKDSRGLKTDPTIGSYKISLTNILASTEQGNDWYGLTPTGRVRLSAVWKPLGLKQAAGGTAYIEPIGVFRFRVNKAVGLPNLETVGKIDPYVRVFVGGFQRARTDYLDDTDTPVWDEVVYVTVQNPSQKILLEAMDNERLGKDRSLGIYEFKASDYIEQDKGQYLPSERKDMSSSVALRGKPPKGQIFYDVQFLPALPIMDPEEVEEKRKEREKKEKERQAAIERGEEPEKDEEEKNGDDDDDEDSDKSQGTGGDSIEMSLEDQMKYNCGIMEFEVQQVQGASGEAYVRITVDDQLYPSYISNRIQSRNAKVMESGEAMIRELSFSETRIEVSTKKDSLKEDDIYAKLAIPTMKLLESTYGHPRTLVLSGKSEIKVTMRTRYFPVLMDLDPRESINNQGTIRCDIIEAKKLPSADRSGKSDPYAVIRVNGNKVFKTKTIKKTLDPTWNESTETSVGDRITDEFLIEVFDWDMGPTDDDFLCSVRVPLAELDPLEAQEREFALKNEKNEDAGTIKVRLMYKPNYVVKKKHGDDAGTFSTVGQAGGKMLTTVGGAPIKLAGGAAGVAGGVAGGVYGVASGGVSKGGSLLRRGFGRGKKDDGDDSNGGDTSAQSIHSTTSRGHGRGASISSSANNSMAVPGGGEFRPGQVTLMGIRGFEEVHNLQLRVSLFAKKEKELFKSKSIKVSDGDAKIHESIPFKGPVDGTLLFKAREHKSLGRDEELGEASLVIGEAAGGEHTVNIAGVGDVIVYVSYQAE